MTEFLSLADAIDRFVPDGVSVAMEGFTHLIPFAAGHELIRQGRRDLRIIRMTPDVISDQLIGAGCVTALEFSWGGNPGVGSLHRFRDAVEHGRPHPIDIVEHSHAAMAARYVAGASGLPFGVLRGYRGTDLPGVTDSISTVTCPFTGEELAAVRALSPDVAVIHAQQSDRVGNVGVWGITGVQKEAVLSSSTVVVTVEEVVDDLRPAGPNPIVLPSVVVDAVVEVPGGSHPSYSMGYSERDNAFYKGWDAVSRHPGVFAEWIDTHVLGVSDHAAYLSLVGRS